MRSVSVPLRDFARNKKFRIGTTCDIHTGKYTEFLKPVAHFRNGTVNAQTTAAFRVAQPMSEEAAVLREAVSMNILIVDDEPTIRETCAAVAQQTGMKATTVASAEEALEVLEHTPGAFELT